MKNDNYKIDSTKCNNKIQNIYLINCVKKIERVYLIYKNRKKRNKNNENKTKNISNNESTNIITVEENNNNDFKVDLFDNIMDYSITHLFSINKVNTKTNYQKFDIPKINNGKSLEMLLNQ